MKIAGADEQRPRNFELFQPLHSDGISPPYLLALSVERRLADPRLATNRHRFPSVPSSACRRATAIRCSSNRDFLIPQSPAGQDARSETAWSAAC